MSEHSTLQQFGKTFQCKIISSLLGDKKFLQTISDILEPSYFDSDANKFLAKTIRDYFFEYKTGPTLEVLKVKIDDIENDILKMSVVENLKESWRYIESTDLPFIQEQTLEFCKNQVIKAAIMDSVDLLEIGKYDEIKQLIDDAMKAGGDRELGHEYIDGIEERLANSARDTVKTGWETIDEIMDGGLGSGELGVVVAPAGIGKCVGGCTKIDIAFFKLGKLIENGDTEWYDPWDKIKLIDSHGLEKLTSAWKFFDNDGFIKKQVLETINLKTLFSKIGIPEVQNVEYELPFEILIKTPDAYKNIITLQRTEFLKNVRVYFKSHNRSLRCSWDHRLKLYDGDWVKVRDLKVGDKIVSTTGYMSVLKFNEMPETILYDISVEDIHCFYGNGILSHNSWTLQAIGASAVKNGLNVVYYTLELNQNYVGLRFDTVFSGVTTANIKYYKDDVKKKIAELKGTLLIKYFPTKGATVQTLSSHLKQIELQGTNIDLVLVDYADILRGVGTEKRHVLESIYEDLRGLAGEYDFPIWTASQANRCHILTDKVETENGEIEIGKIKEGDEILTHLGYKKVNKVFPVEKQPVYKVKLKSGKEITISANHDLPVMYGKLKSVATGLKVGDKLFTKK